jgi:hypothetical protein
MTMEWEGLGNGWEEMEIIDLATGRRVHKRLVAKVEGRAQWIWPDLAPGIYAITIGSATAKVVAQH